MIDFDLGDLDDPTYHDLTDKEIEDLLIARRYERNKRKIKERRRRRKRVDTYR